MSTFETVMDGLGNLLDKVKDVPYAKIATLALALVAIVGTTNTRSTSSNELI